MIENSVLAVERALAFSSLALSSILLNSAFCSKQRVGNWLGLFVLAMGQIVIASEVLSELKAITLPGFLSVHLVFLAISLLVWKKIGCKPKVSDYVSSPGRLGDFARSNWLLLLFGVCVALILVLVVLPTESIPGDAAHYHLARAQYWIENQSARHFFTDDYRQVDFPPNTSFLSMWQILITGSYVHLNVQQWLAAMLSSLAITGLARLGGHDAAKSAFAGLIYLTLSAIVLQMSTPLDDNLTAWLAASFVYFMFLALDEIDSGRWDSARPHLLLSGTVFGLFLGSKLTAAFLIPALGVVTIVWLLKMRSSFIRHSVQLGVVFSIGFLVFGSYNYVLNWLDFGNPVASTAAFRQANNPDVLSTKDPEVALSARNPAANFVRYSYQIMDWQIVKPIPGADTAYLYNRLAYRAIANWLNLDLEGVGRFDLVDYGMRELVPGAEVGYGPIGYLVFLGSLLLLPVAVWYYKKARKFRFTTALLLLGLGWLVLFCFLIPWTPAKVRYFSISFAFLVPAVVPLIYVKRSIAYLWIVPAMALAIWTLVQVSMVGRQYSAAEPSLSEWQGTLLRKAFPPNAGIGTSGMVDFIYYLREFPEYTFTPISPDMIAHRLNDGSLDAVLADDPKSNFEQFRLPFEHGQSLLVRDPKTILLGNLDLYGANVKSIESKPILELQDSGLVQRLGPDLVRIFLPATGPMTMGEPLDLEVVFPVAPPGRDALSIVCGGQDLEYQIRGSTVVADLQAISLSPDQAFLYCEVRISDYGFGNQVPSSSISVVAEPQAEP